MAVARSWYAAFAASLVILPQTNGVAPAFTPAKPQCAADSGGLTLPSGFCAVIVAEKLGQPRHIVVMPNGDVFVSANRGGVIALRDTTGDGRADIVQDWATGYRSSEVRYWNGYLYTETGTAVLRYPLKEGALTASGGADTIVTGLPAGGHGAKTFVIADDGTLYVNIGSRTNSCQNPDRQVEIPGVDPCVERESRAGVWAFRADKPGQKAADGVHFGAGIRNSVAMAINPTDKSLFVMQHGRDGLAQQWGKLFDEAKSAETPAEELFHITKGDDFGWPYCYFDRQLGRKILAPEYGGDGKTTGKCANYKTNVASFPGHWAPNGLAFYTGTMFPAKYRGGAFIAFHGSWNRAPLPQAGYNVVFQPMDKGKASGKYEVFADGFKPADGVAGATAHRPTGLAVGPDGSLYVADDQGGTLYRIMYTGR